MRRLRRAISALLEHLGAILICLGVLADPDAKLGEFGENVDRLRRILEGAKP